MEKLTPEKPSESDFSDLDNLFKILNGFDLRTKVADMREKVQQAYQTRLNSHPEYAEPLLLAVSKTKPDSYVIEAYDNGLRHFGENYVQELIDKAKKLPIRCPDIKWHFIGHLQTNKVVKLLTEMSNLYMVETVDSIKLATSLNLNCLRGGYEELKIMIQVNTSGEENKSGIPEPDLNRLIEHIFENCPYLKLTGLMTIGRIGQGHEGEQNPDFLKLIELRDKVCDHFEQLNKDNMLLSMGMSNDFQEAILMGSNEVRVGSALFGERTKK